MQVSWMTSLQPRRLRRWSKMQWLHFFVYLDGACRNSYTQTAVFVARAARYSHTTRTACLAKPVRQQDDHRTRGQLHCEKYKQSTPIAIRTNGDLEELRIHASYFSRWNDRMPKRERWGCNWGRMIHSGNKEIRTSSSAVPRSSRVIDWIRDTWTPISRWIPLHSMHRRTPRFVESHVGSATGSETRMRNGQRVENSQKKQ